VLRCIHSRRAKRLPRSRFRFRRVGVRAGKRPLELSAERARRMSSASGRLWRRCRHPRGVQREQRNVAMMTSPAPLGRRAVSAASSEVLVTARQPHPSAAAEQRYPACAGVNSPRIPVPEADGRAIFSAVAAGEPGAVASGASPQGRNGSCVNSTFHRTGSQGPLHHASVSASVSVKVL